jgi:predicted phage terminase large subunit-like protein
MKKTLVSLATVSPTQINNPATKDLPKVKSEYSHFRQCTHYQLKFAKDIAPEIFENATPEIHIRLLNFINGYEQYKAAAVFRGAAKSTLLNKVFVINRVFFEFEPFTMIVSADKDKAQNFLSDIKELVEKAQLKGYSLSKGDIWTQSKCEIIVNKGLKDKKGKSIEHRCFVAAFGAGQDPRGYTYKHIRPTLIIADDLESKNGQYAISNKRNRQRLKEWFYADLMPALHPSRGQMIIIGTILHEDSILNNIMMEKEEERIRLESGQDGEDYETHKSEWHTISIPIMLDGKSMWQSRFPIKKIKAIKSRLSRIGLINEFYQEYMCKAMAPEKQLFKRENFNYFSHLKYESTPAPKIVVKDALSEGIIEAARPTHIVKTNGEEIDLKYCRIYTTMDLASYDGADRTAIITFALDPRDDAVYVLDISAGHWTPFEKSLQAIRIQTMFNPMRFGIEKASAQNDFFYTIDAAQKQTGVRIPVEPLSHHSKAKNVRISNLHPLFITGRIYFNQRQSTTTELEAELLGFDPEVESKHDDIMDALAYLMEFIAHRSIVVEEQTHEEDFEDEYLEDDWA